MNTVLGTCPEASREADMQHSIDGAGRELQQRLLQSLLAKEVCGDWASRGVHAVNAMYIMYWQHAGSMKL
jgi:hypothetical protein